LFEKWGRTVLECFLVNISSCWHCLYTFFNTTPTVCTFFMFIIALGSTRYRWYHLTSSGWHWRTYYCSHSFSRRLWLCLAVIRCTNYSFLKNIFCFYVQSFF